MIQFNLLPDVKVEYMRAQRLRRLIFTACLLVSAAAIVILVFLLGVSGLEKKHLKDLNRDIASQTTQLQNKPNIDTILTVQNQLESLTGLHDTKPAADRLFTYLNQLTPASVTINNLSIDYTQFTMTITGGADALSSVNQYVDTLKLTTYNSDKTTTSAPAFSNVVLSSFGINTSAKASGTGQLPASYTMTLSYDKNIFDITQAISLSVPSVTTRAQIQNPGDLFSTGGGN